MLELAILGLLKERSMHGYQLSKRLTDSLGGLWRVSYGSLYPTLKRLERQGAVEQVFDSQEVGRRKNVYRITERGEAMFRDLLEEAGPDAAGETRPVAWLGRCLRAVTEPDPATPRGVQTARGVGYVLSRPADTAR